MFKCIKHYFKEADVSLFSSSFKWEYSVRNDLVNAHTHKCDNEQIMEAFQVLSYNFEMETVFCMSLDMKILLEFG